MLTEKENYLRVVRGEMPEWLPSDTYTFYPEWRIPAVICVRPEIFNLGRIPYQGGRDMFGVEFMGTDSTGGQALPVPGKFILKDVTRWREVIHVPDIHDFDFEAMAKKDLARIDRSQTAVELGSHVGYFQFLMEFMGFTEGLIAMMEEPEAVYELFSYMADFFDEFTRRSIDAYKPDVFAITDDVAAALNPFISLDMYRALVKPFHARLCGPANDRGIPIDMHCCGHCESLIEDWFDFNVCMWNPPQAMNDLVGIKKKYGRRLVLNGCNDPADAYNFSAATEDEVRACVRKYIDTFAPGGGYVFRGYVFGPSADKTVGLRNFWIEDEYKNYGRTWYEKHA